MKLSDFTGVHLRNFWKSVSLSEIRGGCWEWRGTVNGSGYGVLSVSNRKQFVHRLSFFIHNGFFPSKGKMVCHRCHTKLCVNPDHLYEGTDSENQLDRSAKERSEYVSQKQLDDVRGARIKMTKVKADQVRVRYATGKYTQKELAETFGCAQNTISNILNGTSWQ